MQISLYRSYSDELDVSAVTQVIRRGDHWAEGPEVEAFEISIGDYLKVPGVLVCNSGTSALHMALMACGVKHFHEVIVPSFTFIATVNAVRFVGARPVFADIEPETLGLDPKDVEAKITDKTKAIIAVHFGGQPCQIKELRRIATKHSLRLIEDAAEAFGAVVDGIPIGRWGDVGCFSFCANKIITTGEGGAMVTADKYLYDRARYVRSHGRANGGVNSNETEIYVTLGYNWRMSSMTAALGLAQIDKADRLIKTRRQIAEWYRLQIPDVAGKESVYQLYTTTCGAKRDAVMLHLTETGIGCKVYFRPVHLTQFYQRDIWQPVSLPVTERISKEVLSLPMYVGMTQEQVEHVCCKVKEVNC